MKKRSLLIIVIVLLSLLGGISGATAGQLAQVPGDQKGPPEQGPGQIKLESSPLVAAGSGFTYQGRLVMGGSPANGDFDFTFSLYDAATGGNQIGTTITVLTQTLSIGTFSAVLDFGPSAFQGDARWLQIGVRPSGDPTYTILSPRQALTPAPYALSLRPGAVISGTTASPLLTLNGGTSSFGLSASSSFVGVDATGTGTGAAGLRGIGYYGVVGLSSSSSGYGAYGSGYYGAYGTGNTGVYGYGITGTFGLSYSANGRGVLGVANSGGNATGVLGTSSSGQGVRGESTASNGEGVTGVANNGTDAHGVYGSSTCCTGVYGSGGSYGVRGSGGSYGVYGESAGGFNSTGVYGTGYYGTYGSGYYGVYGASSGGNYSVGVYGTGYYGVYANSTGYYGVYARSSLTGSYALEADNYGSGGYAGYFFGRVHVTGGCCEAGAGLYKIDDPTDPANKYLAQSAVESPDMMNIYNGNVTLDGKGEATVQMPTYFQALDQDFRYQLTPIGAPGPNLYIAEEISDNHFKIAGGKPSSRVSWQVTGVRHDPYAVAHPVQVEQAKTGDEKGRYLYPTEYGQPESAGIDYQRTRTKQPSPPEQQSTAPKP